MPNVMGREFPYTAEGMAAAQQYSQAMGMRDGGSMGFRPVGMQEGGVPGVNSLVATGLGARAARAGAGGNLVESIGNATQRGVSAVMGAPVDAANVALGAVGLGATTPVGGAESISNAMDTVAALVQQFTAQGIPEPVKNAVNAAIGTYGIPVDLVNSALSAIGVPVSDNPIGGSQNLTETFGMRDGGSMGFRPVGYDEGGPVGYADGDVVLDNQSRAAVIEKLMDMTGMGPNTFVPLTNGQLINAVQKVEADALAAQMQQMQQMQGPAGLMAPTQQMAPAMPDPTGVPPEGGDQMLMPRPGMAGGGIMSLRGY